MGRNSNVSQEREVIDAIHGLTRSRHKNGKNSLCCGHHTGKKPIGSSRSRDYPLLVFSCDSGIDIVSHLIASPDATSLILEGYDYSSTLSVDVADRSYSALVEPSFTLHVIYSSFSHAARSSYNLFLPLIGHMRL